MLTRITGQPWGKWHVSSQHESRNMEVKPTDAKLNTLLDLASDRTEQKVGKDRVLAFAFPRTGVTFSNEVIGRARTEQAMDTSVHIVSIVRDRCTFEDYDEVGQ
jgi:A1 cistron-splicing factor AAR2